MHAQVVYFVSVLLHLSAKTYTTFPVLFLFFFNSWDYLLGWDFSTSNARNQFGNFSPISFWGRGTQQGWFQPCKELCLSYMSRTRTIPRQAPRQEEKEPCASELFCQFLLSCEQRMIPDVPCTTLSRAQGLQKNSRGVGQTDRQSCKRPPWSPCPVPAP